MPRLFRGHRPTRPAPISWAGGCLPDQVRLNLALGGEHRFGSGTVYLCYHPA